MTCGKPDLEMRVEEEQTNEKKVLENFCPFHLLSLGIVLGSESQCSLPNFLSSPTVFSLHFPVTIPPTPNMLFYIERNSLFPTVGSCFVPGIALFFMLYLI